MTLAVGTTRAIEQFALGVVFGFALGVLIRGLF